MRRLPIYFALLSIFPALNPVVLATTPQPPEQISAEVPSNSEPAAKDRDTSSHSIQTKRVLLIATPDCKQCEMQLKRLHAAGGPFELLRKRGWRIGSGPDNHIQLITGDSPVSSDVSGIVSELKADKSAVVICVEDGKVIRSFKRGCTTPLDEWTFGWLMTGNDKRPKDFDPEPVGVATTGHYPLRGNHWSVEGLWNPSRDYVVSHLRITHLAELKAGWEIETWSYQELLSLHDDLHEREEGFQGRYSTSVMPGRSSRTGSGIKRPGRRKR